MLCVVGLTKRKKCLVRGKLEFVDDADVRRPGDDERREEVDDAGGQHVDGVSFWKALKCSRPTLACVRPYEHRNVERHVVDPNADDNDRSYASLQSRSTELVQSQESAGKKLLF